MTEKPKNWEQVFAAVAALSERDIVVVAPDRASLLGHVPALNRDPSTLGAPSRAIRKAIFALDLTLRHVLMGLRMRHHGTADAIIVTGFMTQLLGLLGACAGSARKKTFLVVNHNLQEASIREHLQRHLVRAAERGFRFLIFDIDSPVRDLDFASHISDRFHVIPHPAVAAEVEPRLSNETITVGLIGRYHAGKGQPELLERIVAIRDGAGRAFEVLLATDDLTKFPRELREQVSLIDTSGYGQYEAAMARCDVMVLGYSSTKYYYRSSGVIADAIGHRTHVVCPDFPVLTSQVAYPVPVGRVYGEGRTLEEAVLGAVELAAGGEKQRFDRHFSARSLTELARQIDRLVEPAFAAENPAR